MSERSLPLEVIALGEAIKQQINDFEKRHPGVTVGQIALQHVDDKNAIDGYNTKVCSAVACNMAIVALTDDAVNQGVVHNPGQRS